MDAKERLVELFERERERALAAGLRVGVVTVLASRRFPCSEASLARICSCTHVGELTRWIGLAATAASEAEVFEHAPSTEPTGEDGMSGGKQRGERGRGEGRAEAAQRMFREYARLTAGPGFDAERPMSLLGMLCDFTLRTMDPAADLEEYRSGLLEIAGPEGREEVMNAFARWIAPGRAQGEQGE